LPANLETLGEGAFYFNSVLTEISVPASVKSIGSFAFYCNTALETVSLAEGLETIGDLVFDTTLVKNLYLPSTLTHIGDHSLGFVFSEELNDYSVNSEFEAACPEGSTGQKYCEDNFIAYKIVDIPVKPTEPPTQPALPTEPETQTTETTEPDTTATSPTETVAETEPSEVTTAETSSAEATTTAPAVKFDMGDVTLDGKLNIKDVTAIQKHLAKIVYLEGYALDVADYDLNGKLNIKDATTIQKVLAGLI